MVDETTATHQRDVTEGAPVMNVVECPNCKNMVPFSLFCVACQFPLFSMENQEETPPLNSEEISDHSLEPIPIEQESPESSELPIINIEDSDELDSNRGLSMNQEDQNEPPLISEEEIILESKKESPEININDSELDLQTDDSSLKNDGTNLEPKDTDTSIQELIKNIVNCISLKLWSITQLFENKIEEEQFIKMFDTYEERYNKLMNQRMEWIEKVNDLASLEQTLKESIVGLEELKMRRSLKDLHEGEFEVMAPAYEWKIKHVQSEMSEKKKDLESLRILALTIPQKNIEEVKDTTRRMLQTINEIKESENLSKKALQKVSTSLIDIQLFFENHNN
jgi:hypothetical protein